MIDMTEAGSELLEICERIVSNLSDPDKWVGTGMWVNGKPAVRKVTGVVVSLEDVQAAKVAIDKAYGRE